MKLFFFMVMTCSFLWEKRKKKNIVLCACWLGINLQLIIMINVTKSYVFV